MRHDFTAAAQRALAEAAAWSLGEPPDSLEAPALLLGLLAESECRAAITLARHGIDAAAVREQWPALVPLPNRHLAWDQATRANSPSDGGAPVCRLSPDVEDSLRAVGRRLRNWGLPTELGTEHMLLGLVLSDDEVSRWLRHKGLDADALEADMHRVHGYQPPPSSPVLSAPLPLETGPVIADDGIGREIAERGTQHSVPMTLGEAERLRALRVIDAAANRAREGLRVVEDYVRFVLDDRFLTTLLKGLRHDFTDVLRPFLAGEHLAARDTLADVGTQVATAAERCREDTASVLAANFARLQESLRSLEEFAKVLDPATSAALEQLRYRSYTLQRAVETTRIGVQHLGHTRLYVLMDGCATFEEFRLLAQSLVCGGVHVVQLRDKRLDDRALVERARALREITSEGNVLFIMNDRSDLAVLSRADGVHVGQEELSVKDARTIVGPRAIIGVSTHTIQQARQAVLDGANYLGVGPTFPSETKQFDRFPGVELLRAVAAEIRLPAFAIGGIRLENLPLVIETGLRRIAVGAAIAAAPDPACAARAFLARLGS